MLRALIQEERTLKCALIYKNLFFTAELEEASSFPSKKSGGRRLETVTRQVTRRTLILLPILLRGFAAGASGKECACQCRRYKRQGLSPCWEDPLEEGTASHSSILAWRMPWTEKPGGLQSRGSQGVGHDGSNLVQYTSS